jgi:hypothetical protein
VVTAIVLFAVLVKVPLTFINVAVKVPVLPLVYVPFTLNCTTFMVNAVAVVSVLPELILIEFKVAAVFTSSVTVKPPSINTSSPATGIAAPGAPPDIFDHVAVEFHPPVATLYTLSASALFNKIRKRKMK